MVEKQEEILAATSIALIDLTADDSSDDGGADDWFEVVGMSKAGTLPTSAAAVAGPSRVATRASHSPPASPRPLKRANPGLAALMDRKPKRAAAKWGGEERRQRLREKAAAHSSLPAIPKQQPRSYSKRDSDRSRPRKQEMLLPSSEPTMLIPEGAMDYVPKLRIDPRDPPKGKGMQLLEPKLLMKAKDAMLDDLPWAVREIPCFDRASWVGLNTHRYCFFVFQDYPTSPEAQQTAAATLRRRLSQMIHRDIQRRSAKKEGDAGQEEGEPVEIEMEVMWPQIERVPYKFVDIRFTSAEHHAIARAPPERLYLGTTTLEPWCHGAFVDPSQHFVLQFSHALECDLRALRTFALRTVKSLLASNFRLLGLPVAVWLIPEGFPHSKDFEPSTGSHEKRAQFIVLLRDPAVAADMAKLPPYVPLQGTEGERVKIFWDRRPDLCDYCKSAWDCHLNNECTRKPARDAPL